MPIAKLALSTALFAALGTGCSSGDGKTVGSAGSRGQQSGGQGGAAAGANGATGGSSASGGAAGTGGAHAGELPTGSIVACSGVSCPKGECDDLGIISQTVCEQLYPGSISGAALCGQNDGGYCLTVDAAGDWIDWGIECNGGTPTAQRCEVSCGVSGTELSCN